MSTQLVQRSLNFTASSDPLSGSVNRRADGSSFEVRLSQGIQLPANAIDPVFSIEAASIWWTTPNIVSGVNDQLVITGPTRDNPAVDFTWTITITEGLWSLTDLSSQIQTALDSNATRALTNPLPIISLQANTNTQRAEIILNYPTVTIDFSHPRSFHALLGFGPTIVGPFPGIVIGTTVELVQGIVTANLSPAEYFLISTTLVDDGLQFGDKFAKIAAQVFIDQPTGFQIQYEPRRPPELPCKFLRGSTRNIMRFGLLDHRLRPSNTGGSEWSIRFVIKWYERVPMI